MSDSVAELNAQLEKEKVALNLERRAIASVLGAGEVVEGGEDIFIAHTHEFGVAHTLEAAQRDPSYFGMKEPPSASMKAKLEAPLGKANALIYSMMELVTRREEILRKQDPARKPHYMFLGREFYIDPKMQTVTYLDTGETNAFIHDDERPRGPCSPSRGLGR